jgi:hypothetical protein
LLSACWMLGLGTGCARCPVRVWPCLLVGLGMVGWSW